MSHDYDNFLLTKDEGCIEEYWPKVVAVQTECN